MLQIDSINHDCTCGFRIIFRFETYEDVIALGFIIKGLVATIPYRSENGITPDAAFVETISTMIPHEAVKGITRVAEYDDSSPAAILEFGALDPKDLKAINDVHNDVHGFRKNHGYADKEEA